MPSLFESGNFEQQTSPRVEHRPNPPPDIEQKDSAPQVPDFDPGNAATLASSASPESNFSSEVASFNIKDAIYSYAISCRDGTATSEALMQHVVNWIEGISCQKGTGPSGASLFEDFAACVHCQCFLHDPVTISCGHTYCKMCLSKLSLKTCIKCGQTQHHVDWMAFKTNVVIANVISKWWPGELKILQLKQDGSKLVLESHVDNAIENIMQAFGIALNGDHFLTSSLSYAHLQIGQAVPALHYAEVTIKLRPDWPKGYCRKGFSLLSLGQYEDAAIAFLQCLTQEPHLPSIIMELTKVLHQIICTTCCISTPYLISGKQERSEDASLTSMTAFAARIFKGRLLFGSSSSTLGKSSDIEVEQWQNGVSVGTGHSKRKRHSSTLVPLDGFERLSQFLDRCQISMDLMTKIETKKVERTVDSNLLDTTDFECILCLRTFWQPVTTPCGHIFCRTCLNRCLDHTPRCPLCKSSLEDYLAERRQFVTEFIDVALHTYFPEAYAERKQSHLEDINELTKNAEESSCEVPVFVCTVGLPTVPCPLHVFEPRYRLMIRRCLESGTRLFGMCSPQEGPLAFSDHGTTLEIQDVQYLSDGRVLVDAVGRERFHVLQRNMKDGYHTARIEFLKDQPDYEDEIRQLHDAVHSEVLQWFSDLHPMKKNRISRHFGSMPDVETDYHRSANGPAWVWWTLAILPLDARAQLAILSMTSLRQRLEALHRTLTSMPARTNWLRTLRLELYQGESRQSFAFTLALIVLLIFASFWT